MSQDPAVSRETSRVRIRAYGRVQGVGFRYFVRRHALHLGLSGYVRNCADGSVEMEAAGPDTALSQFRHTVAHGPPGAHVERAESLPVSRLDLPRPFEIRR
jgi:acylphosphatase